MSQFSYVQIFSIEIFSHLEMKYIAYFNQVQKILVYRKVRRKKTVL